MFFASVMTEREVSDAVHVAPLSSIGIDFGTRQDWTASTGPVKDVPGLSEGEQRRKLRRLNSKLHAACDGQGRPVVLLIAYFNTLVNNRVISIGDVRIE